MKKLLFALFIAFAAAGSVQAQSKVAHVNTQKLLDTLPSRKKAIQDIGAIEKQGIEELTEMDAQVRKYYEEYSKLPAGSSPSVVQYSQEKVQKAQQGLETRQQEIDLLMQKMSQEMNDRILKMVKEAVDIVAKKKGFNYVIDENGALFASGTDITNDVITELMKLDAKAAPATTTKP